MWLLQRAKKGIEMTLEELERAITRWGDITYLGVYTLRKDGAFIKMVVNGASRDDIDEYLREEYPDHFEEEDGDSIQDGEEND
jgi:hypothetical protein